MESQPNSSQTPAHAAELKRRQVTCTGGTRQGVRRTQTTSHAPAQLPALRLTGRPKPQPDRRTQDTTVGGQTTAHPKGLKQTVPRRALPAPTCPPHPPEGRHSVNRQGSTTPGPHESLLQFPTGRNVLLKEPYERLRWHINGHRQQRRAALDPKGEHHPTATRAQVTAKSKHPEISSFELRQFHSFTPERFHALLNSLFRVLFNFPSRYLFAIGLVVVFSLWRSLPPTLGCTLKQPDSTGRAAPTCRAPVLRALHPLWARGRRVRSNLDISVRKRGAKTTLP
jgi:hypothetical protein